MAKKSAICGEYIIEIKDSGTVEVYKVYNNTVAALREIAASIGFEYSKDWNTRQFGSKLVDHLNNNKK